MENIQEASKTKSLSELLKVKIKCSLSLINEAPRHEDVWRSGGKAPPFSSSILHEVFRAGMNAMGEKSCTSQELNHSCPAHRQPLCRLDYIGSCQNPLQKSAFSI
jgi:hypothetical protein